MRFTKAWRRRRGHSTSCRIQGVNDLAIRAIDEDHIIWWVEEGEVVLRVVSLAPMHVDVPPVPISIVDSAGAIVPRPPTPTIRWHESFRYFRLSQTTEDLFDAYRNSYLALESVLSGIAPQRTHADGRGERTRR